MCVNGVCPGQTGTYVILVITTLEWTEESHQKNAGNWNCGAWGMQTEAVPMWPETWGPRCNDHGAGLHALDEQPSWTTSMSLIPITDGKALPHQGCDCGYARVSDSWWETVWQCEGLWQKWIWSTPLLLCTLSGYCCIFLWGCWFFIECAYCLPFLSRHRICYYFLRVQHDLSFLSRKCL